MRITEQGTVWNSSGITVVLLTFLVDKHGFERNPYDYCVVNKVLSRSQCTIVQYVDDLKISHRSNIVVSEIMALMKDEFGKDMDLTIMRSSTRLSWNTNRFQ
jgi:hypothetical protein